jgi:hypothetical protein
VGSDWRLQCAIKKGFTATQMPYVIIGAFSSSTQAYWALNTKGALLELILGKDINKYSR